MKKILLILLACFCLTGCFKKDSMEGINIETTVYPIEYITKRLYGNYSTIESIYPNGVNVQLSQCDDCNTNYTLTDKQLEDYSDTNLFVFNSLLYEGNYVKSLFQNNKNLKIINATDHLSTDEFYGLEELWLDPSRMLTLARNVKNGFDEYISNYYMKQDIENNFNTLKEELDKLDSKLSDLAKNADNKTIVVGNDVFNFLAKDKYGLKVYSLEESNNLSTKTISDVKELIKTGKIKYIYIKQYEDENDTIKKLIENTNVEVVQLHMITNLTDSERTNKKDYFTIMNDNIELLRKGLYNK